MSKWIYPLSIVVASLFAMSSLAGVVAYSGPASEKLFIESAPKLGKDIFLIKFEGPESKWAGKVIKAKKETSNAGDRYGFDYTIELSSGKKTRHYYILAPSHDTLKNGSIVKQVDLYFPEGSKDGLKMTYDEALSKSSQSIGLDSEHKKAPFTPEVD